jgi:hypothetical protein
MRIRIPNLNPIAIVVAIVSSLLAIAAVLLAVNIESGTTSLNTQRDAMLEERAETVRWQHEAPSIVVDIRRAGARIANVCTSGTDTNALLLKTLSLLNAPTTHVTATLDDLIATYPDPTPMPTTTPKPSLLAIPATPAPAFTPHPYVNGPDHTGVATEGLVAFRRNVTVVGTYPNIVAALARLGSALAPIEIGPPSITRLGENEVTFKAPLTLYVPTPAVCTIALANNLGPIIAPAGPPTPTPTRGLLR